MLVIEINARRNHRLIGQQNSMFRTRRLKLGHDSSASLGTDGSIQNQDGMTEIFKNLLQVHDRFCKIYGDDNFLLRMILQRFDGQIPKEIDLARLDDLKTTCDACHGLCRIGTKSNMTRIFVE